MIDFIVTTKHLRGKDTPNFADLQYQSENKSGWIDYAIMGNNNKVDVAYNPQLAEIKILGSLMYFIQGHNLTFDKRKFTEAVKYISSAIDIDLWDSNVLSFENGVITDVSLKPKEYIKHHKAQKKSGLNIYENSKDDGCFRSWENSSIKLKMYDVGKNAKQKLSREVRAGIEGWNADTNYLKFEVVYKKPYLLNKGDGLLLADLVNPKWELILADDLVYKYTDNLEPMKSLLLPNDKKDLSTSDLFAGVLTEFALDNGKDLADVKKMLYDKVNSIPDTLFSDCDKKARKRQIRATLDKLEEAPQSQWDLSEKLECVKNRTLLYDGKKV